MPPRNGFLFPFLNSTRVGGRCRSPTHPSAIKGGAPAGAFTGGHHPRPVKAAASSPHISLRSAERLGQPQSIFCKGRRHVDLKQP